MFKIIQGDTSNLTVIVEKGAELIKELWFSCDFLEINKILTKVDETHYVVSFEPEFTCNCKVCDTSYDITAILKDNQVSTVIYNNKMKVLKKENKLNGNQN